eukprot:GFYU01002046.1.p1 GENE.GFYU01002046.1~~GFYU01002046.1.p1  ORF type:complete len:1103 (-),score=216.83 GFYU01002046.1:138-3446(-)
MAPPLTPVGGGTGRNNLLRRTSSVVNALENNMRRISDASEGDDIVPSSASTRSGWPTSRVLLVVVAAVMAVVTLGVVTNSVPTPWMDGSAPSTSSATSRVATEANCADQGLCDATDTAGTAFCVQCDGAIGTNTCWHWSNGDWLTDSGDFPGPNYPCCATGECQTVLADASWGCSPCDTAGGELTACAVQGLCDAVTSDGTELCVQCDGPLGTETCWHWSNVDYATSGVSQPGPQYICCDTTADQCQTYDYDAGAWVCGSCSRGGRKVWGDTFESESLAQWTGKSSLQGEHSGVVVDDPLGVNGKVLRLSDCASGGDVFSVEGWYCTESDPCWFSFDVLTTEDVGNAWTGFSNAFPGGHAWTLSYIGAPHDWCHKEYIFTGQQGSSFWDHDPTAPHHIMLEDFYGSACGDVYFDNIEIRKIMACGTQCQVTTSFGLKKCVECGGDVGTNTCWHHRNLDYSESSVEYAGRQWPCCAEGQCQLQLEDGTWSCGVCVPPQIPRVYMNDFEHGLWSFFTGKDGDTARSSGIRGPDPLGSGDNVLGFRGCVSGGDVWTQASFLCNDFTPCIIEFEALQLTSAPSQGWVGVSNGYPGGHRWLQEIILPEPMVWTTIRIKFTGFEGSQFGPFNPGLPVHVMLEDYSGDCGDVFINDLKVFRTNACHRDECLLTMENGEEKCGECNGEPGTDECWHFMNTNYVSENHDFAGRNYPCCSLGYCQVPDGNGGWTCGPCVYRSCSEAPMSGVFQIQPDYVGPIYDVKCEQHDGQMWTRVYACNNDGTAPNLPDDVVKLLAHRSATRVHIRTAGDVDDAVTSAGNSLLPVQQLKLGLPISHNHEGEALYTTPTEVMAHWEGSPHVTTLLTQHTEGCVQATGVQATGGQTTLFNSCGNVDGLRIVYGGGAEQCGWDHNTPADLEVYINDIAPPIEVVQSCALSTHNGLTWIKPIADEPPALVQCDCDFDGQWWTRIVDCTPLGSVETTPRRVRQWLVDRATQVHIRTQGRPWDSVTSAPDAWPITELRDASNLSQTAFGIPPLQAVNTVWQGPRQSHMWATCGMDMDWDSSEGRTESNSYYWACNNQNGLHASERGCKWDHSATDNDWMEFWVNI